MTVKNPKKHNPAGIPKDYADPIKPIDDGIDDWEYENKSLIDYAKAFFYTVAVIGLIWVLIELASINS